MKTIKMKWNGIRPILMHNPQLADPSNEWVRAMKVITSKGTKNQTDADREELRRLEWYGGLYQANGRVVLTENMILGTFIAGAKKSRRGPQAKLVLCSKPWFELTFEGDDYKSIDQLYANNSFVDVRSIGVQKSRVMRTRPIFRKWSCSIEFVYDEGDFNVGDMLHIAEDAGRQCGVGDWHPRYGLFEVEFIS